MPRLLAFAFACSLLTACVGQSSSKEQPSDTQAQATAPPEEAAKPPERRIPDDSLYPLLVAEFALRRGSYDVALQNYAELAPTLRDARVSEHTTHLSQFMQREPEALQASQLWVELAPDDVEANNTLATLLIRQGRTLEALPHLAVVERGDQSAHFPLLLTGFATLSEQQRSDLARGINELAVEFPGNTGLLLTQALLQAELEQYDESLDKLDAVFKLEPQQPQALLLEANILVEVGDKKPFAHMDKVLRQDPENQLLRLQYARLLTRVDMPAAREQFEILSAQSPRDGDLLFSLALISRDIGDYQAASTYLHEVLALEQRVDEANYYLGRNAEDAGTPAAAISYYLKVGSSREFLAANSRIGQILIADGQRDRSRALFHEQRQKTPQESEQLFGLEADILAKSGFTDDAIGVLNQALAETPDVTALVYSRAMLYEQQGNLAAMERDLRSILAREPDNATALNALGYTLANHTRRYEEALQLISRALALQPNEPAILDSMGWVLYRTGLYAESIDYLSRAYAAFPDPEVASHLGEVLWVSGKTDAAMKVWQGASMQSPNHPVLRSTLERLGIDSLESSSGTDGKPTP